MDTMIDFSMTSRIDDELINKKLQGRYRFSGKEAKLIYRQSLSEDEPPVTEILSVALGEDLAPLRVRIHRPKDGFELCLEKGVTHRTVLSTPAGPFEVNIQTLDLLGTFEQNTLDLTLSYRLIIGGQSRGDAVIRYQC